MSFAQRHYNLFCIKLDPVDMLRNTIEFYLCLIFFSQNFIYFVVFCWSGIFFLLDFSLKTQNKVTGGVCLYCFRLSLSSRLSENTLNFEICLSLANSKGGECKTLQMENGTELTQREIENRPCLIFIPIPETISQVFSFVCVILYPF